MPASLTCAVPLALLLGAVGLSQAQSSRPAGPQGDPFVRQVRTALGHGAVADARILVSGSAGTPAARELGTALVEVFEGADDAARKRLQPLADAGSKEAALELGLLERRHGQRDSARRRLMPIVGQALVSPDDYLIHARARSAVGDPHGAWDSLGPMETSGRADIYTEIGDLYLQKHKYGDAVKEYTKAVAADSKWVPAYLGMARAFADQEPQEASAVFAEARKIAPEDPGVWLLAAERALATDDMTTAKTALDQVAKLRPGTVREAALRGAIAYGEWHPAEVDAAVAHVREIDPTSPAAYLVAGEEAARKYRFEDAAEYARKGSALDPADADAQADLGLYLMRTADEVAGRAALESAWAADNSNPLTKNLLDLLDTLDKFVVVQDGPLVFKFPKDEVAVLKPYALPLGDTAYKTFAERYGFTPKGPIVIEVFGKHDDFAVRTIGLAGLTGALGACFGRLVTMDSPKARPPGDFSWQATEWHELAHVFTLQLSDYRVPRWLTEGLSVYEEHRRVPAWGRELTIEFARNLSKGRTFGVKGLPEGFKHGETLSLAYFEASLVVEHLVELNGDEGVRTLLKAYAGGATDSQAFEKAFGKNIDAVDDSFAAFVKQRYGALSAALADPPSEENAKDLPALKARAEKAPGNFYSQWTYGRALFDAGDLSSARAPLEKAAQLAPPVSGSVSPHGLLAQIAEKEGDLPRARKELRELLTYDHENVDAARHLALLAEKNNATEDQDIGLRLVADLDPFDGTVHSRLGRRELAKGHREAALIEFQAALALGPANLAEAHADVGEVLLALGRRDDAKKEALQALQQAPSYARAQELLLSASAR